MFPQKIISITNEMNACIELRKNLNADINDINILIQHVKKLNLTNPHTLELCYFIEDLANAKYGDQRNNHNLMKTFLKEKINSHKRIQYDLLDNLETNGDIPYAKNLAPAKIMSNYFFSNKTELDLNVQKLEEAFLKFTRSDRTYLSDRDECIDAGIILLKINNNLLYDEELEDIKKYFALQLTRREFYLHDIVKTCLTKFNSTIDEFNLMDYLCCKYIYNKSLLENFQNWYAFLKDKNKIRQIKYITCNEKISYIEARANSQKLKNATCKPSNLAITEVHTFILAEFIERFKSKQLDTLLTSNGFEVLTENEIHATKDILVTVGSGDKLCYLMEVPVNNIFFDKINFLIHTLWDWAMIKGVLVNLLLSKDSKFNEPHYFKKGQISQLTLNRAKFMGKLFDISTKFESIIKNSN